jgi:hypothetical protein
LRPSEQASVECTFLRASELADKSLQAFWDQSPWQRQQVVEQLARQRSDLLYRQDSPIIPLAQPLTGGRILAFNPEETVSDGMGPYMTGGFLDCDCVPAWDTWISYVVEDSEGTLPLQPRAYFLSWVPEALVPAIERAIDVDMLGCLQWASDLDTAFIRQLRQEGLLR